MTFFALLIALLVERFFDLTKIRHWQWLQALQRMLPGKSPQLVLLLTVAPVFLALLILEFSLRNTLHGLISFLLQLAVLFYCLGPRNLWFDTTASINALQQPDHAAAAEKLQTAFNVTATGKVEQHTLLTHHIFIEANRRLFGVVFWFIIFGAAGAFLYRAISLIANNQQATAPELTQPARTVEAGLDWFSIRVFGFLCALGGHFVHVLACLSKKFLATWHDNQILLIGCGMAAISSEKHGQVAEDGSAERAAISLIDRSLVILLIVVGIIELIV